MTIKLSERNREGKEGEIKKEKVSILHGVRGNASIDGTEQYSGLQTQASQTCLIN